jgi:hypothetical protein
MKKYLLIVLLIGIGYGQPDDDLKDDDFELIRHTRKYLHNEKKRILDLHGKVVEYYDYRKNIDAESKKAEAFAYKYLLDELLDIVMDIQDYDSNALFVLKKNPSSSLFRNEMSFLFFHVRNQLNAWKKERWLYEEYEFMLSIVDEYIIILERILISNNAE